MSVTSNVLPRRALQQGHILLQRHADGDRFGYVHGKKRPKLRLQLRIVGRTGRFAGRLTNYCETRSSHTSSAPADGHYLKPGACTIQI